MNDGFSRAAPDWCHAVLRSEDDTRRLARQLAAHGALRHAFVALHGELGAGKTTLVRHWLRALGVAGRIKSPTYAVVEPYEITAAPAAQPLHVWHFDFYRFDNPREWEDAGLRDIFASAGLKLAEWPQNAAALLPPADLSIHLELLDAQQRRVALHAGAAGTRAVLEALVLDFSSL